MVVINISLKSCHFFLLGCGTGAGGLSQEGGGVSAPAWPGSGVSVNASLDVTKLSDMLQSRPGSLKEVHYQYQFLRKLDKGQIIDSESTLAFASKNYFG